MSDDELERIAIAFASKHTPKGAYSISKIDLKFGFKEGAKHILKELGYASEKRVKQENHFCEYQDGIEAREIESSGNSYITA